MKKIIGNSMYRGVKRRVTAEDIWLSLMALVALGSIVSGIFVSPLLFLGLMALLPMGMIWGDVWEHTPRDYRIKYSDRLVAETYDGQEIVLLLNKILKSYPEEIKYIVPLDMLFDEVWDQVGLANITRESLQEYEAKLQEVIAECERIKKKNLLMGRSASTSVVDLALETAKELQG